MADKLLGRGRQPLRDQHRQAQDRHATEEVSRLPGAREPADEAPRTRGGPDDDAVLGAATGARPLARLVQVVQPHYMLEGGAGREEAVLKAAVDAEHDGTKRPVHGSTTCKGMPCSARLKNSTAMPFSRNLSWDIFSWGDAAHRHALPRARDVGLSAEASSRSSQYDPSHGRA
eukprot:CAMPEP_0176206430 /NCGR_PEP_ID=MMETSP0121_2-20121125/12102_1 /TAXON_ID=160619 /ORGANISM="Kryptoperidinium foliaceum, Strain CCMP 1326" /LENGTH=172 /DNA_ID=CAMNT_0017545387 /DNA_START=131 /DNA_END=650 /DNA_ORIENTATION=+